MSPPGVPREVDAAYFSQTYDEARTRFREFKIPGAEARSFPVPSPRDADLSVDYLYRPPSVRAETLLVITSGVHGAEGFAGSAIQSMFLSELLTRFPFERTGLLMVHGLNPFGMKYGRRATENNVNLNRNFGATAELFETKNEAYDRLAEYLEPRHPAGSPTVATARAISFVAKCLLLKGFTADALNRGIAHGQFTHPRGIEYGGRTWEPQIRDFIAMLKRTIEPFENIVIFDLHTGLGKRYELHLIPIDDPASRDETLMARLFKPDQDGSLYRITTPSAEGFYKTAGELNGLASKLARPGQRTLTLTFEYGTLGNGLRAKIQSLARVVGENQGFHRGYTSEKNRRAGERAFAEMFTPTEVAWRANVVARARDVLTRVLGRL